jgi:hypothetical protein
MGVTVTESVHVPDTLALACGEACTAATDSTSAKAQINATQIPVLAFFVFIT